MTGMKVPVSSSAQLPKNETQAWLKLALAFNLLIGSKSCQRCAFDPYFV